MKMELDYFYAEQAEQFTFYRIPKALFSDSRFKDISTDSKVLYGRLLDRISLSAKNGWTDDKGRIYIIYTIEQIMEDLCCGNKKAGQLLAELEEKAGLIERKRQGLGKPNFLYVKNFITGTGDTGHFKKCQNDMSGSVETTSQEVSKGHAINTDLNDTDLNDTDPFPSSVKNGREEETDTRTQYREYLKDRIEYDILKQDYPNEQEMLNEILELLVDTICANRKMIRIAGDDKPVEVVKSSLLKLNADHIRMVMSGMKENTTQIRNIRQYLMAALYNAPLTIGHYYSAQVAHDMAVGMV